MNCPTLWRLILAGETPAPPQKHKVITTKNMDMFKTLQIEFAHHAGKIIDDKKLTRKKHDFEYKNRTQKIECTFSKSEHKKLSRQAQKAGLPVSAYLKATYFAFEKKQPIHTKELQESFNQTLLLLWNVANNINQIARKVNTVKKVTFGDLLKSKIAVHELEKTVEKAFLK